MYHCKRRRLAAALALSLLAAAAPVWAQAAGKAAPATRTAWIDAQAVLDGTQSGKEIKKRVEAFRDARQQVIDLEEAELKTLEGRITQQGALLSDEARRQKEAEFQQKLAQYQKKVLELNKELQDKKDELLGEFNEVLMKAVASVAAREGYQYVLDHGGDGTVLYASPELDLTAKVTAEIDAGDR